MPITAERMQREIETLINLPTLPGVVQVITSMVDDERVNAQQVGDAISKDQVLSAKVLRLVNSPFYGFPGRISTVSHAIVLLGFNVVKGLLLSTAVFDSLDEEVRGLWEHSLGTAVISRAIAKHKGLRDPEEVMVAGLLHDIGKVILSFVAKEDYLQVIQSAHDRHLHVMDVEYETFGFTHTAVSGWLAQRWSLPERLADAMRYHHRPEGSKNHYDTVTAVQIADALARGMEYGDAGDSAMPAIDAEAFRALELGFEAIPEILEKANEAYHSGVDLFGPGK